MNANSRHYSSIDLMATSSRQRAVSDQLTEFHSSDRATSEARFLLREFSHRINNEFSSAIGAISIAAARSTNVEARGVLDAAQDRLQNYAKAHRALRFPEQSRHMDTAEYLRRLCQAITHSRLSNKGIELRFVERGTPTLDEFRKILATGVDCVGTHHQRGTSRLQPTAWLGLRRTVAVDHIR
jgi:two-component sensor histidine kinase